MILRNSICHVSFSGHEEQRRLPSLHLIFPAASYPLLTVPGLVQWLINGDQSQRLKLLKGDNSIVCGYQHGNVQCRDD